MAVSKDSSGDIKPKTPSDMRMRIKHTEDSVAYNKRHMKDHAAALQKAETQLKSTRADLKRAKKK